MNTQVVVTKEQFIKRLTALCLRGGPAGFPKNEIDEHILLKSAVLVIPPADSFSEAAINEALAFWIANVNPDGLIDHGSLRRRLIDTGYLTRERDGSSYRIAQPGPRPDLFTDDIEQLDVVAVIRNGRAEIERRKQEYLDKARENKKH